MDNHGSDAMKALKVKGAARTQLKETDFCRKKRTIMTKFIRTSLDEEPSITWIDLAVNSVYHLLHDRTEWRWYQAHAEGKHVITSPASDGRTLHRKVVREVRAAAGAYSQAVVDAIHMKKGNAKRARIDE